MSIRMIILVSLFLIGTTFEGTAQRFAYVDTEYILNSIPEYKDAQEKLDELAKQWQKEIEAKYQEIDELYQSLQAEEVLLTEEMKRKREKEIMEKKREVRKLQEKRFGKNGDLYKKRKELIQPIQDKVYRAIKDLAESRNYEVIFDKSDKSNILYAGDRYDKSDRIIKELGYEPGAAQEEKEEGEKGESDKGGGRR